MTALYVICKGYSLDDHAALVFLSIRPTRTFWMTSQVILSALISRYCLRSSSFIRGPPVNRKIWYSWFLLETSNHIMSLCNSRNRSDLGSPERAEVDPESV